ncbi:MAG: invasion associated locus B family protein [Arenicella sp.]|nr:invasion associated locus B family protein [Arenicella sp.]
MMLTRKHVTHLRSIVVGLTVYCLLSGTTAAQEDYTEILNTSQRFGDWFLNCETVKGQEKSCVMTQKLFVEGQELMQANFAKIDKDTQMTLIFPLGIFLPEGVELEIVDHLTKKYPINFCSSSGCFVNQVLEPETVQLLRQKEKANIKIYTRSDQPAEIPFSISGFLDAHRKL